MNRILLTLFSIVAISVALFLFTIDTDREVSRLTPTEGVQYIKPLLEETTYRQDIRVQQAPVTRIGLFLRRIKEVPSDSFIHIKVNHNDETVHTKDIVASGIDNSAPTYIVFNPPLDIPINKNLRLSITVDPELSGTVGIQTRVQDETFTPEDTAFYIQNEKQTNPAAYETYVYVKPPLALQLAGLLLVAVTYMLLPRKEVMRSTLYILAIAHVAILPYFYIGHYPLVYIVTILLSLAGMYTLLRYISMPIPYALFGAHIFAFTTWFPLQITGGNTIYIAASLLPWISYSLLRFVKHSTMRPILTYGLPFLFLGLLTLTTSSAPHAVASIKDVFLDPNQSPFIQKQVQPASEAQWFHFGSYVGIPALGMTIIGFLSHIRNREGRLLILLLIAACLFVFLPSVTFIVETIGVTPAHMSIYLTYLLAITAAVGMRAFSKYLGKDDRLIHLLLFIIVTLSLLDQWHVLASVGMQRI